MLLFNKKISAHEACSLGLVTEVFPDNSFQTEVWKRIESYAKLPKGVSICLFFFCHVDATNFVSLDNFESSSDLLEPITKLYIQICIVQALVFIRTSA